MTWNYSNTSVQTTLSSGCNAVDTSIVVAAVTGFPVSYPYTLILDFGETNQEAVTVTAGVGTTLTVTRGVDGTTAGSHVGGAVVVHGIVARDLAEPQAHIAATTDVHGLAGGAAIVGTTSSQTLTNKTLTSPTINTPTISSPGITNGTISGATITGSTLTTPTITVADANLTIQDNSDATKQMKFEVNTISSGTTRTYTMPNASTTLVGTDVSQTLTNKVLSGNAIQISMLDNGFTLLDNGDNTKQLRFDASGISGSTTRTLAAPDANTTIVGTDATQTLTNKTLTTPSITSPTISGTGSAAFSTLSVNTVSYTELGAAWTSYTPTWSGSTGAPAIGNGTIVGRQRTCGKTVEFQILLTVGSTTTFGSGFYYFSLPSTAVRIQSGCVGFAFDVSGGAHTPLVGIISNAAAVSPATLANVVPLNTTSGAVISGTAPFTFANGDIIQISGMYEAA